MLFVCAVLVVLLILCGKWLLKRNEFNKKLEKIPGPKPLPILGNVLSFMSPTEFIPNLMKFQEEFGGVYKVSLGPIFKYIILTDSEWIQFVLSSNKLIHKSHDYDHIKCWLGEGLVTALAGIWKRSRKAITPAFHFQILEQFVSQFPRTLDILVNKLTKETQMENNETDIYPFITLSSLDSLCETALGISIHAQEKKESEYVSAVRTMLRIMTNRIYSPWKQFDILYQFSSDYREEVRAVKILHKTTDHVIRKRKADLLNKTVTTNNEDEHLGIKKKEVFLNMLIKMNEFTDKEIRQEVDTIMFAGHDSTASATSFAFHLLANNPDVQEKVMEELYDVLGDNKTKTANYREIQELKYLEMVIKETLRIYPSVHFYARQLMEDVEFKGITLPQGLSIIIFPYGAHRVAEVYPDPEKFDPERFSIENQGKRNPYSYVPFSAGPRNCIGQKFAMLSMKATITRVLMNFELLPVPNRKIVLSAETILKTATGIYVQLKKR